MEIFISWSGTQSRKIAEHVKKFIKNVIQATNPFISTEIDKGTQWFNEIASHLTNSEFGIICLTKENLAAPWILFESGALFKGIEKTRICTLLFGVSYDEVKDPLSFFNGTRFSEEQVFKLVQTINTSLPQPLEKEQLLLSFNKHYKTFSKNIEKIVSEKEEVTTCEPHTRLHKSSNKVIGTIQNEAYRCIVADYERHISDLNLGIFKIGFIVCPRGT